MFSTSLFVEVATWSRAPTAPYDLPIPNSLQDTLCTSSLGWTVISWTQTQSTNKCVQTALVQIWF